MGLRKPHTSKLQASRRRSWPFSKNKRTKESNFQQKCRQELEELAVIRGLDLAVLVILVVIQDPGLVLIHQEVEAEVDMEVAVEELDLLEAVEVIAVHPCLTEDAIWEVEMPQNFPTALESLV